MNHDSDFQTQIGRGGRIVLPSQIRKRLELKEGDTLIIRMNEDEMRLFTPQQAIRRAQTLVRRYVKKGRTLSEELIKERRVEAKRE